MAAIGRVWLVLPAYNEAGNLQPLLAGVRQLVAANPGLDVQTVVVDDGSSDDTADIATREAATLPLELLRNGVNRGLAETFKRGVMRAVERAAPDDVIVCMDADNSHLPEQIPELLHALGAGKDVVIASRYRPGAVIRGVSWSRRTLSRGMSLLFQAVYPVKGVRDYSCGYRAYRAGFVQTALKRRGEELFSQEGFACMVGILLHLEQEGARCGEIPLVLRYDQKLGASKMPVGNTVQRTLSLLVRERLRARS
jgi:dolichol-phosphate mannosyltransferase